MGKGHRKVIGHENNWGGGERGQGAGRGPGRSEGGGE